MPQQHTDTARYACAALTAAKGNQPWPCACAYACPPGWHDENALLLSDSLLSIPCSCFIVCYVSRLTNPINSPRRGRHFLSIGVWNGLKLQWILNWYCTVMFAAIGMPVKGGEESVCNPLNLWFSATQIGESDELKGNLLHKKFKSRFCINFSMQLLLLSVAMLLDNLNICLKDSSAKVDH